MSNNPLVSIIMPAYNAETFIRDAVYSVINQTYSNWELIIIDDGSTDSTASIVKELAEIDGRINYHFQKNGKQGKARNLGIKNSNGYYLAFLDADDLWTKDKLSIQIDMITRDSEVDLIFSQGYSLQNNETADLNVAVKEVWDINDFGQFIHHNQIPILSVLVKKDAVLKACNFTEKTEIQNVEDYHLWLKLLIIGNKFKSITNRLFYYRIHANQSTFENANTEMPIFNTFLDIYDFTKDKNQKKTVIQTLKWSLFNTDKHQKCINLFCCHLKKNNFRFLSFLMKNIFNGNNKLQNKITFQLIANFG